MRLKRMSGVPAGCFLYGAPVVSKGTSQSIFWSHLEQYNNTPHIFQKHLPVHMRRKLCPHLNPAKYIYKQIKHCDPPSVCAALKDAGRFK